MPSGATASAVAHLDKREAADDVKSTPTACGVSAGPGAASGGLAMSVYDLTGRKALVTGGTRGLGEGLARGDGQGGPALGTKHGFRAMRPGGPGNAAGASGGAIVNVASAAATIAFPGIAGYSATKSAVDRLTRAAAMESGGSTAAWACDNSKKRRVFGANTPSRPRPDHDHEGLVALSRH